MKIKYRAVCLILVFFLFSELLLAVPAITTPLSFKQSDGTVLTVRLVGNEMSHYYTLLDGTPLKRLSNGDFQVMQHSEFAELQSLQNSEKHPFRVAKASKKTAEGFPTTGSLRSLVILVGFTDVSFKTENARQAFSDLLNKQGYDKYGATGSAADYFHASSNDQFQPQFEVGS